MAATACQAGATTIYMSCGANVIMAGAISSGANAKAKSFLRSPLCQHAPVGLNVR